MQLNEQQNAIVDQILDAQESMEDDPTAYAAELANLRVSERLDSGWSGAHEEALDADDEQALRLALGVLVEHAALSFGAAEQEENPIIKYSMGEVAQSAMDAAGTVVSMLSAVRTFRRAKAAGEDEVMRVGEDAARHVREQYEKRHVEQDLKAQLEQMLSKFNRSMDA